MDNLNIMPAIKFTADALCLDTHDISDVDFEKVVGAELQKILKAVHKESFRKQTIKKTSSGLMFACPYCGDSSKDDSKKRGNISLRGSYAGRFKCFNCGHSTSLQRFFKDFNYDMSLAELNYVTQLSKNAKQFSRMDNTKLSSNVLNSDAVYEWAVPRDYIKHALDLKDISKDATPMAYAYLMGRCQTMHHERFLYSEKSNHIIILNLIKDRVVGLQMRSIDPNYKGAKYITTTLEKLRAVILNDTSPIPTDVSKLSCVFNIFGVDFYGSPILVTEGPFDAFLLPNCIAISGASKNFAMEYPFWYLYDSDETGKKHSLDKLQKRYHVFMWQKFISDFNLPYRKKWDITDVMVYMRNNNINARITWADYFTDSALDGLDI